MNDASQSIAAQWAGRGFWVWLVGLACLWRGLIAWRTPIPAEDGVNYLWMAEQFAAGELALALSEVFPPLLSLLVAPWIALGLDPVVAGQGLLCVLGGLAVVPMVRICMVLQPGHRMVAAALVAIAPLPVRYAGEVYSEPLFLLLGANAVLSGLRHRGWWLGVWAGLAFWVRPEAVLLVFAFLPSTPRVALRGLAGLGAAVLALMLWRGSLDLGFAPVAKLDFNLPRTIFAESDIGAALRRLWDHATQLPGVWLEAFSVAGVFAVAGMWRLRDRRWLPLLIILGLALVALLVFLPRRRFLVSWWMVMAPFALRALLWLPHRPRTIIVILIVISHLILGLRGQNPNRRAEIELGRYLRQHAKEDLVVSDMTRVLYFAGRRPLPPRHHSVEELLHQAKKAQWLVLGAGHRRKAKADTITQRLQQHFEPARLPSKLSKSLADRGIRLLRHRQ